MIKIILTKTGDQIITKLDQYINPETNEPVGFVFTNPFVVKLVPTGETAGTENPSEFSINYTKWMACSKDTEFKVAFDYVAAVADPEIQILENYINRFGDIINDTTDGGDAGDNGTSDSSDNAEEPGVSDSTD